MALCENSHHERGLAGPSVTAMSGLRREDAAVATLFWKLYRCRAVLMRPGLAGAMPASGLAVWIDLSTSQAAM